MSPAGFIAVLLIAFIVGAVFYFLFKSKGPWGSFWTFFLVVLLGVSLAYVWVRPFGPVYWGVAFFPLLFIGLLFALLLAAATPPGRNRNATRRGYSPGTPEDGQSEISPEDDRTVLGIFFWTAVILFAALLIAGIFY
ncbi:hypothetical protein ACFSRY_15175 [Pontibacter locisalis]|uniref:Uncharacterized protein n=1 Tax=Pontibacter locisalis TaxID=1719035 RepID=A0ABW5IPH8_9BACT